MQRAFAVDLARLSDTDTLSQSFAIGNCSELFVVGESLEQIESFIIGNCGEHFMAGEHFAVDESFATGNCGELFVAGENLEQIESFIFGNCGVDTVITAQSSGDDMAF